MYDLTVRDTVNKSNLTAILRGFYSPDRWHGTTQADAEYNDYRHGLTNEQLLHACIELGEAADKYRKTGQFSDDVLEELADVFIVVGDLVGRYGLDSRFVEVLEWKLDKNLTRAQGYGNARAQREAAPNVSAQVKAMGEALTAAGFGGACCGDADDCRCGGH